MQNWKKNTIIIGASVIVIITILLILLVLFWQRTCANPNYLNLNNQFECNFISDQVFYDNETNNNIIEINFNVKYIEESDTQTSFFNHYAIVAKQNGKELEEAQNRKDNVFSNQMSMSTALSTGNTTLVNIYYYLKSDNSVTLDFINVHNSSINSVNFNFKTKNKFSIFDNQKHEVASINGAKITTVDNWQIDNAASVCIKLINSKTDAKLSIEYDMSLKSDELMNDTISLLTPKPSISQIYINSHLFNYCHTNNDSFVLTTNSTRNVSIKITGNNTQLDECWSQLESIEIY